MRLKESQRIREPRQMGSVNPLVNLVCRAFMVFVPMAFLQNILIIDYTPRICKIIDPSKPVI